MWDFSATFAFCIKANGLATLFIAPKSCIFWGASFEPIKNVASLFAQKLQGFNGNPLYHCYTLRVGGCFGWMFSKFALSEWKHISLDTKKADQQHFENQRVSLVQNSTHMPECAIEVIGEDSCEISWLKVSNNPPLAPVPFRALFDLTAKKKTRKKFPLTSGCVDIECPLCRPPLPHPRVQCDTPSLTLTLIETSRPPGGKKKL